MRPPMDGAGHKFLTRSGFACDENRGVGGSDLGYTRKYCLQCGRSSDDVLEHRYLIDFFAQSNVLFIELIFQGLDFLEGLFQSVPGVPLFRNVDNGADKFNHLARVVSDGVSNAANIFYGIVWKNDAEVVFCIVPLVELSFDGLDRGTIVRMYAPQIVFRGRSCGFWVEAKNLKHFGRPENPLAGNITSPTSCTTKPLGFREIGFAFAQVLIEILQSPGRSVENLAKLSQLVLSDHRNLMLKFTS